MSHSDLRSDPLPVVVPLLAAAGTAMRWTFGPGISICFVVVVVLAPVWLGHLGRFRGARALVAIGFTAALWGIFLTLLDPDRASDVSLLTSETVTLLSMVGAVGTLLWVRSSVGVTWTAIAFAIGALANTAFAGGLMENLWKYSLVVPVALILLALADRYSGRLTECAVLLALAAVSAVSDSRSITSFLLLSAAVVIWQLRQSTGSGKGRPWQTLVGLLVLGLGMYSFIQSLILDGLLGDAAQQRSQTQLDATGSLITGGRPELGAALALILRQPWGYGSGTVPRSLDVWAAKTGMSELNYDPNNGYVEVYMFGGHFEVHSVLGDLWIRFGPLGALFALLVVGYSTYSVAARISTRTASAVVIFLVILGLWDTFFSPFLSSYRTLALFLALAAIPLQDQARGTRTRRSPRGNHLMTPPPAT